MLCGQQPWSFPTGGPYQPVGVQVAWKRARFQRCAAFCEVRCTPSAASCAEGSPQGGPSCGHHRAFFFQGLPSGAWLPLAGEPRCRHVPAGRTH